MAAEQEHIDHYERVLNKSKEVLNELQQNPFNQSAFNKCNQELKDIYTEIENPQVWIGSDSNKSPLFGFPDFLDNIASRGVTTDMLSQLQKEILAAEENLRVMKEIKQGTAPTTAVLNYIYRSND